MDLTQGLLGLSGEIYFLFDGLNRSCTILNPSAEEYRGMEKFSPVYSPRSPEDFPGDYAHQADGEVRVTTWPFIRTDGEIRQLEVREQIFKRLPDGSPWQIIGSFRDITGQTEAALREQQLRSLIQSLKEGLVQHDSNGAIIFANSSAEKILGLTQDQLKGLTAMDPRWQVVREDGSPFPGEEHPATVTLRTGRDQENVIMGVRKPDGRQTWISINSKALKSSESSSEKVLPVLGAVVSFSDITANRLDRLLKDLNYKMREYARNHTQQELTKWLADQAEKVTGSTMGFYQHLSGPSEGQTSIWSTHTETQLCSVEKGEYHRTSDPLGVWAPAMGNGQPLIHNDMTSLPRSRALPSGHPPLFRELIIPHMEGASPVGLLGVGNKRTDYVDLDVELLQGLLASYWLLVKEKQVQDLLVKMRSGLECSVIGYAFADLNGYISYVNPAFLKLWGYSSTEQVYGRQATSFWEDPEKAETVTQAVKNQGYWKGELTAKGHDGSSRLVQTWSQLIINDQGQPVGLMATFSDETESRKLQAASRKLEQLESLGTLAGGIAHDFNNLMGGIYGCIDMATVIQDEEEQKNYLLQALNTMGRAKELTRQLLTFSTGGEPKRREGDLAALAKQVVDMTLSGTRVEPEYHFDSPHAPCLMDELLMTQVIRNMTVNALQSMPGGGRLKIRLHHDRQDNGDRLVLDIEDQGEGILPENLGKIFDPFFTTRETGTGLGLSTCHSIVGKHGGTIEVVSERGRGSTFRITLPGIRPPTPEEGPTSPALGTRKGRILILDDEPMLLQVCGAMVRELGYEPRCVSTCREALAQWKQELNGAFPFAGAILDLTIPGEAGGVETARQLKALSPQVPLFVSSGYSGDPVLARPGEYGFHGSLHKPFTMAELAEVLRGAISP